MVFSAMGQNSTSRVTTSREKEKSTAKSKLSKITLFRKIPREGPLLVASGIEPCSMGVGYILCLLANKANTETTQEDTKGGSDICGIWFPALPSECGWHGTITMASFYLPPIDALERSCLRLYKFTLGWCAVLLRNSPAVLLPFGMR